MGVSIGFYLLADYEEYSDRLVRSIPESAEHQKELANDLNSTLKS
jgi:predicted PurR-regulated permease PerM